jgi:dolichol-phosphate mannosyltransferase
MPAALTEPHAERTQMSPPHPTIGRTLVSLATYNERDNLPRLLDEIHQVLPNADILVIDDNSPDGTGRVADERAAADPRIQILHRAGKLGLGTAIMAGMRHAIDRDYDYLINMDADFSHHPRYLPALADGMNRTDVMIGSRYIPGGGTANWPLARRMMSWGVGSLVRLLLRIPARDTSGAFRCYRVARLRQLDFDAVISRGYSFQQEMLWRCQRVGCRIAETPIFFENRRAGASKVNPHEAVRSIGVLLYLGIRNFFGWERKPLKEAQNPNLEIRTNSTIPTKQLPN